MNIYIEPGGSSRIFRVQGRLDGANMQQFEAVFLAQAEEGIRDYVFDLSALDYISSAGLRVMLLAMKRTRSAGGKLALFGLTDMVSEIFQLSGFTSIFQIFATEAEALQYLAS